jgi:hypothetical protein
MCTLLHNLAQKTAYCCCNATTYQPYIATCKGENLRANSELSDKHRFPHFVSISAAFHKTHSHWASSFTHNALALFVNKLPLLEAHATLFSDALLSRSGSNAEHSLIKGIQHMRTLAQALAIILQSRLEDSQLVQLMKNAGEEYSAKNQCTTYSASNVQYHPVPRTMLTHPCSLHYSPHPFLAILVLITAAIAIKDSFRDLLIWRFLASPSYLKTASLQPSATAALVNSLKGKMSRLANLESIL